MLPADTWVDFEAGATVIDEAEGALRAGDPMRLLGPATAAVNVARRPFLAGIEGDWVESQRRRQERVRLRALDCISQMWLAGNEPQLAVEAATEAIELDPFREASYQFLMRAYGAAGNSARGLRVYRRLRELLQEELGTGSSPETDSVYKQLLR